MDIEVRQPDISHLINATKKYVALIDKNNYEILEIWNKWNELLFDDQVLMMENDMFPSNGVFVEFRKDCKQRALLSLYIAWAIGREFVESYPDNAKYCLAIEDHTSEFLPKTTQNEIIDLADYAIALYFIMLVNAHKCGYLDEVTTINVMDQHRKMFRQGTTLVFQDGIYSYYKEKR